MASVKEKITHFLRSYLCLDVWESLDSRNKKMFAFLYAITVLSTGYFIYYAQSAFLGWILSSRNPLLWYAILLVLYCLFLVFCFWLLDLVKIFRVQKIYERPSYAFFLRLAFVHGFIASSIFKLLQGYFLGFDFYPFVECYFLDFIAMILLGVEFQLFYMYWLTPAPFDELTHAYAAIAEPEDLYEMAPVARSLSSMIRGLNRNVNVLCITGPMGSGKSSLIKMALEDRDMEKSKFLYTYISLTESNAENDFSKLFFSRWLDSLNSRYPIIKATHLSGGLQEIVRSFNHDWINRLFLFLFSINRPFFLSSSKVRGETNSVQGPHITQEVSKVFGGIDSFSENFWVIVVDEIERAQPGEIYRVIEIIERFKNVGDAGLPVKIVFILPVSWQELAERVDRVNSNCCDMLDVAQGFFSNGSKSITNLYPLPVPSPSIKRSGILKKLNKLFIEFYPKTLGEMDSFRYVHLDDSTFNDDSADRLESVLSILNQKTARLTTRVLDSAFSKVQVFSPQGYYPISEYLPLPDLLALEVVGLLYPSFYNFMGEKAELFSDVATGYWKKKEIKQKYSSVLHCFEQETGVKLDWSQKDELNRLLQVCAFQYIELFRRDNMNMERRRGTTSHPDDLADYFTLQSGQNLTGRQKLYYAYVKHKEGDMTSFEALSDEEFKNYIYFLRRMEVKERQLFIDLLPQFECRFAVLRHTNFTPYPRDLSFDEASDGFVYAYEVIILALLQAREDSIDYEYGLFHKFLFDEQNQFKHRFILLDGFVNRREGRGMGSSIYAELNRAFEQLKHDFDSQVSDDVTTLFGQLKFFIESGKNLLLEEKNFFYILYQSWSGKKDNSEELEKIQSMVSSWLKTQPVMFNHYWDRLPSVNKKLTTSFEVRDVLHGDHPFTYFYIKDLISLTMEYKDVLTEENLAKFELWSKFEPALIEEIDGLVKDDKSTLMAELLDQELLSEPFWLTFSKQS